ncbi:hypothetical protein RAVI111496_02255 [Rahnella victoriana]|uniref:hypothetical protein n=1 Tax=Rahnella victoriana TaxID=1510570 RepID=UPI0039F02B94
MDMLQQLIYLNKIKKILGHYSTKQGKVLGNKAAALKRLGLIVNSTNKDKLDVFTKVSSQNYRIRDLLNLSFSKRDVYVDTCAEQNVPIKFILGSFLNFYSQNLEKFEIFESKRKELERFFARDDYLPAITLLDDIDESFGKSIWSLDCRMALTKKIAPDNNLSHLRTGVSHRLGHISFLLSQKQLSKSPLAFQQQVTNHSFAEMRKGSKRKYAEFLSFLLLNGDLDKSQDGSLALVFTQRLYPIDKLIFITKIISEMCSNQKEHDFPMEDIHDFIVEMSAISNDPRWTNLKELISTKVNKRTNIRLESILAAYSLGDYKKTIELCNEFYQAFPEELSIIDIHAKSIYFLNKKNNATPSLPYDKFRDIVVSNLYKSYLSPKNYESSLSIAEDSKFRLGCFECVNTFMPAFYSAYPFVNQEKITKSCTLLTGSPFFITPKHLVKIKNEQFGVYNFEHDKTLTPLSKSREYRRRLEKLLNDNESNQAEIIDYLHKVEDYYDITPPEIAQLRSICFIKTSKYHELLELINNSCSQKSENTILFPISHIAQLINDEGVEIENNLELALFCFICFQTVDKDFKDIVGEFMEKYLIEFSCSKPSELLESLTELSERQLYFFDKVCSQSILSAMRKITLTKTMMLERIKIINILHGKFKYSTPTLEKEEKDIYQALLLSRLSSTHGSNKITIDSTGLYQFRKSEYENILFTLSFLKSFEEDTMKDFILEQNENAIDSENNDAPPPNINTEKSIPTHSNAVMHYYGIIYSQFIDDFIMNEEYGVVRYLSSEIRHGVMPNQMRSIFEAEHLVTEIDSEGRYKNNKFWSEKYSRRLNVYTKERIMTVFTEFSRDVDTLITKSNSWTKPLTSTPQNAVSKNAIDSAFVFLIDDERIMEFVDYIENEIKVDFSTNINEEDVIKFYKNIEDYIWSKLDECFINIKRMLNEILKSDFNSLCEELKTNLASIIDLNEFTELEHSITITRNRIIEKINHIEGWFRRPIEEVEQQVDINDSVQAAIYCLRGIYEPSEIIIDYENCTGSNKLLNNRQLLSFTRAVVTMVMNCLKHGELGKKTTTSIVILSDEKDKQTIIVKNKINSMRYQELFNSNIRDEVSKFPISRDTKKLVTEGGTGLYKAYRNIKDGFDKAEFGIDFDEQFFSQQITLVLEGV